MYDMEVNNALPKSGFSGIGHCTAVTTLEANPTKKQQYFTMNRFSIVWVNDSYLLSEKFTGNFTLDRVGNVGRNAVL